ncbi:MAG: hypothetical protein AAGA31_19885 [Bacteroidota bacterium]
MKKSINKLLLGLSGLLVLLIGGGFLYLSLALPNVGPPPAIEIAKTPEQVTRGSYLANHMMVCMDCHSQRDWNKYAGPSIASTLGQGGEKFGHDLGFPGEFYAPNITPAALGSWTDGEIFRAVTTGVSKDGRALFNVMPYHNRAAENLSKLRI